MLAADCELASIRRPTTALCVLRRLSSRLDVLRRLPGRLDESALLKLRLAMRKGNKMPPPKYFAWVCLLALGLVTLICSGFDSMDSGYLSLESLKPALAVSYASNVGEVEDSDSLCRGRRVYMYELPSRFNSDFYRNKSLCDRGLMAWLNLCPRFTHGGYGVRYLNHSQLEGQWDRHWYDTDSYMLEMIYHSRMQSYRCRTLDPSRADAFFIPYYTGIDALRLLYEVPNLETTIDKRSEFGTEIVEWMDTNARRWWRRFEGRDHFFVLGRTTWDFRMQDVWGTGFSTRQFIANTTNLMMEREPTAENEQAIPYPTGFHPSSPERLWSWILEVQSSERKYLMSYVGAPRPELDWSIRGIVGNQCTKAGNKTCLMVDCHKITCSHNPIAIYKSFLQSNFCLQPRGDSATRRSTFDCLIAGSIPVFFHPDSAFTQYTWHLPSDYSTYSVYISEDDLKDGVSIQKILGKYSPGRIRKMRKTIVSFIPNLIYNDYSNDPRSTTKDAFELGLQKVIERVADYKRSLAEAA